jgi:hypothetical protein
MISMGEASQSGVREVAVAAPRIFNFHASARGGPRVRSKLWKALDREIGQPGENRGQVVAHWKFQPEAAFQDRENRCNLRSYLWTADVDPILPASYGEISNTTPLP